MNTPSTRRFDLDWMRIYGKDKSAWLKWVVDILKGYDTYALFSLRDPVPFIRSVAELLLRVPRKIKKMVLTKTSGVSRA